MNIYAVGVLLLSLLLLEVSGQRSSNPSVISVIKATRPRGVSTKSRGDQCRTPDNKPGECAYIYESSCRSILNQIQSGITQELINYLRQAIKSPCGWQVFDFTLCCETSSSVTTTTPSTTQECGKTSVGRTRGRDKIVGGKPAKQGQWPWAVILGKAQGGGIEVYCGGSLLNEDTVLTAAHCMDGTGINLVRLGDHDITTTSDGASPVDKTISRTIIHRGWNSNTLANDIAIVKLSSPVSYSSNIKPVCLPEEYKGKNLPQTLVGPSPVIIGWGSTQSGGGAENVLREARVPMVTQKKCKKAYSGLSQNIRGTMLCAGQGEVDTCNGDSGGALLANNIGGVFSVVGITSFGVDCADPDFPGVYTRVDKYIKWIKRNM